MLLAFSLLAPLFGPCLVGLTSRTPLARATIDGFVLFFIAGLVGLHIIPESVLRLGWVSAPALVVGLALPKLLHPHDHDASHRRSVVGMLGALALVVHAATDGLALAASTIASEDGSLPLAIGVHRVLEGAGVWWLLSARHRAWQRLAALVALCATAGAAWAAGQWALGASFGQWAAIAQLTVAGSLLHLLVWHVPADETACSLPRTRSPTLWLRVFSAFGAAIAAATLFALEHEHHHEHGAASAASFSAVALWSSGCVGTVLALALAGLAHAWFGHRWRGALPAGRWRGAAHGAFRGLFVPSCSCGVVALGEAQRAQGTSTSGLLAYIAVAPALGWVGFVLSIIVLGPAVALTRSVGLLLMGTISAAMAAPWEAHGHPQPMIESEDPTMAIAPPHHVVGLRHRLRDGAQFALGDLLDFTAPWVLFSLLLCTSLRDTFSLLPYGAPYDVLILAALALLPFLCGASSTLMACLFWQGGASVGACLTFAWLASSTSIASTHAVVRWCGAPRAARLVVSQVVLATAMGLAVNKLCMASTWAALALWPPRLRTWGLLGTACCVVAAFGMVCALARLGARGFLGQILWANRAQAADSHHH